MAKIYLNHDIILIFIENMDTLFGEFKLQMHLIEKQPNGKISLLSNHIKFQIGGFQSQMETMNGYSTKVNRNAAPH